MSDPDDDGRDRRVAVNDRRGALRLDARRLAEIEFPDRKACEEEHGHEQRHRPEDELLPGIEPPQLRHVLFLVAKNAAKRGEPGDVVPVKEIVAPELDDEARVAHEQHAADPGMDRARPLPAAE